MTGRVIFVTSFALLLIVQAAIGDSAQTQRLIRDAEDALEQARLVETVSPKKARALLQGALKKLEGLELNKAQQEVVSKVRTRIEQLNRAVDDEQKDRTRLISSELKAKRDKFLKDAESLTPPKDSPADFAAKAIGKAKNAVEVQRQIRDMQNAGMMTIYLENQRDRTIPREQRFTERYLWALKHRHTDNLSKEDRAILKILATPIDSDFNKTPLKDVIPWLEDKTGLKIVVNADSLKEVGVEYEEQVTFRMKNVPTRFVLRKILQERGLTYIIKGGVLHVITLQQARDPVNMTVRNYPVADLVSPDPQLGPFLGQQFLMNNAQGLINLIKSTTDPAIWQNGATITFDANSRTLTVLAPAELHLMMGYGMKK